jgi:hypothetical protein
MTSRNGDREIARLFEAQRRADEASAPAFRDLLARPRNAKTASPRRVLRPALAAAAVLLIIAAALLLRSRAREPESLATASALAAWRAPTDVLLRTPGAELTSRLPVLVSPAAQTRIDISHD